MFNLKNKVFSNTIWLLSEKLLNILGLIFVTSAVAKYIGPEDFGKLNLSIYYFSIFQVIAIWGSDVIGLKLIAKYPTRGVSYLISFTFFKFLVFLVMSTCLLIYFYIYHDKLTFIYSLSVCISSLFYVIDWLYIYNEARLFSFLNVITNILGLVISLFIRVLITKLGMDPVYLSFSILAQGMLPTLFRFFIYKYKYSVKETVGENGGKKKSYVGYGVKSGLSLLISAISVMIYINIGRVFLSSIAGLTELGIYSVAITLGTTWVFLSNALIVSFTPKIFSSNKTDKLNVISFLQVMLVFIGLLYLAFFFIFGHLMISILYGDNYIGAYNITLILIVATTFSSLGIVSARFVISDGGYSFEAKKTILTALCSIFSNLYLINKYGVIGAGLSSLISELLSLTIFNYFYNNRLVLKLHASSFSIKKIIGGCKLISG